MGILEGFSKYIFRQNLREGLHHEVFWIEILYGVLIFREILEKDNFRLFFSEGYSLPPIP